MKTTTCNYGHDAEQPNNNFKAEGDELIKKLTNGQSGTKYCLQFFFDTEVTGENGKKKKKLCQIAPMRSRMIYDLKRDYNVDVKPNDFSTVVYRAVWAEGTYRTLDCFSGKSPFFSWLKKVARNAVLEWLVDERQIKDVRSRTVGNTRLSMLSQAPSKCKMVIDDLMVGSKYHSLLTAIYVDKLSEEKIMKQLHIKDAAEFEAVKKAGDDKLKDALLRSAEYSEADFLHDKKTHVVPVSIELATDLSEWVTAMGGWNPLSDVFGTNLTDEEVRLKTVEFLYDFSAKLWRENLTEADEKDEQKRKEKEEKNKRDRYIWCRRFIENVASKDVAKEVGHDSGWLDTRYSRLNAVFREAIKQWWKSHAS